MPKDFSKVRTERDIFAAAWNMIDRHKDTPHTKEHEAEFDGIAFECLELSKMAEGNPSCNKLAAGIAHALMDYYTEELRDF